MTQLPAGWYDDGTGAKRWWDGTAWTDTLQTGPGAAAPYAGSIVDQLQAEANAGARPRQAAPGLNYVVLQVVLKEKFIGTGSGNLTQLEKAINQQAALGYRLHTITTSSSGSTGFLGGDRIQATMVFEKIV